MKDLCQRFCKKELDAFHGVAPALNSTAMDVDDEDEEEEEMEEM